MRSKQASHKANTNGPVRVKSVVFTVRRRLPVYPGERTSPGPVGMSQTGQEATCQIQTACAVAFSRDAAAASRMTPDTVLYATTQADFAAGVQASFNPCSSVHSKAAPTVS